MQRRQDVQHPGSQREELIFMIIVQEEFSEREKPGSIF